MMKRTTAITLLLLIALAGLAQAPEGVEAIDLGLPSGTKWANMNVGATVPTDKGGRYAWGELETKNNYTSDNYLYYYDGGNPPLEWFHPSSIYGSEWDVAHVRWEGKWRMPKAKDYEELMNNCSRESATINGVKGIKYTGPNGHSIFLPSGTYWTETKPWAGYNADSHTYCWSSSKDYRNSVTGRYVLADYVQYYDARNVDRVINGNYVRPVMDDSTPLPEISIIKLDEAESYEPVDSTGIIRITTTFKHGWNTFCVPFTLKEGSRQLPILFNFCDYNLYTFSGYSDGTFYFVNAGKNIQANTPYLLWYNGPTQTVTKYITGYWYGYGEGKGYNKMKVLAGIPSTVVDGYTYMGNYEFLGEGNETIGLNDYLLNKRVFENNANNSLSAFKAYLKNNEGVSDGSPIYISVDGRILEERILLDEDATTEPEPTEGVDDLRVKRTIKAGEWSTLALPFFMNEGQLKEAFGDDVQLAEFEKYEMSDDKTAITVFFKEVNLAEDGLTPRIPYIIKTSKDISEFTLSAAVEPWGSFAHYEYEDPDTQEHTYGFFVGTYRAGTTVPENCLFLSDNSFWYSTGQTVMKGFRAFFDFKDILLSQDEAPSRIKMSVAHESSGITHIETGPMPNDILFDLQGRQVTNPTGGLYIRNGKKVWLKKQ